MKSLKQALIVLAAVTSISSTASANVCNVETIKDAAVNWGRLSDSTCSENGHQTVYANAESEKHIVHLSCEKGNKVVTMVFRIDGTDCIMTNGKIQ